jgi:hypothetical protein
VFWIVFLVCWLRLNQKVNFIRNHVMIAPLLQLLLLLEINFFSPVKTLVLRNHPRQNKGHGYCNYKNEILTPFIFSWKSLHFFYNKNPNTLNHPVYHFCVLLVYSVVLCYVLNHWNINECKKKYLIYMKWSNIIIKLNSTN